MQTVSPLVESRATFVWHFDAPSPAVECARMVGELRDAHVEQRGLLGPSETLADTKQDVLGKLWQARAVLDALVL